MITKKAQRADELVAKMKARLDSAVAALDDEENWVEILDVVATFGAKYSLNNQLLILAAAREMGFAPTFVQSWNAWFQQAKHELGCAKERRTCKCPDLNVPAGVKGIPIWAPRRRKLSEAECDRREADTGKKIQRDGSGRSLNKMLVGYQPTYVFDVAQLKRPEEAEVPTTVTVRKVRTSGPQLLTGDDTTGRLAQVIAFIEQMGVRFEYVRPSVLMGANGATNGEWVRVRADLDDSQKVKTAVHEWAHILCGHVQPGYGYAEHRGQAETEVESIAYIVCGVFGLDTGKYSAPYVGSWSNGDPEVIHAAAETVIRVAKQILALLAPAEFNAEKDAAFTLAAAA